MDPINVDAAKVFLNQKALIEAAKANLLASDVVAVKFFDVNGNEIYTPGISLRSDDDVFDTDVSDFKAAVIASIDTLADEIDAEIEALSC